MLAGRPADRHDRDASTRQSKGMPDYSTCIVRVARRTASTDDTLRWLVWSHDRPYSGPYRRVSGRGFRPLWGEWELALSDEPTARSHVGVAQIFLRLVRSCIFLLISIFFSHHDWCHFSFPWYKPFSHTYFQTISIRTCHTPRSIVRRA